MSDYHHGVQVIEINDGTRVAEGTCEDEEEAFAPTVSNITGTTDENGKYTGLKALLTHIGRVCCRGAKI